MLISYLDESAGFILTFIILFVHDFHMVIVTSSHVRSERKPFPQELCDCFTDLIQLLVTNICLEQKFQKLKEEIITKFEKRFMEQNRKLDEPEQWLAFQDNSIN